MKTVPFSFEVETFQGEKLDSPIAVTGVTNVPETDAEFAAVRPNEETLREWIVADLTARAKAKARADQLKTKMEEYKKSDAFREKDAVRSFRALLGKAAENLSDAEILERARQLGSL